MPRTRCQAERLRASQWHIVLFEHVRRTLEGFRGGRRMKDNLLMILALVVLASIHIGIMVWMWSYAI